MIRYLVFDNDGIVHRYRLDWITFKQINDVIEMCSDINYHNRKIQEGLSNDIKWNYSITIKEVDDCVNESRWIWYSDSSH